VARVLDARIINRYDANAIFTAGPGHCAPGVLAPVYLEGAYSEIYPNKAEDEEGMCEFFKEFSFPGGIGSHCTPETPSSIHEGGCVGIQRLACIWSRHRQTGPLATSWHCNKFLKLPILNLNGYKINNPTLLSRISPEELESLFRGYGWTPTPREQPRPRGCATAKLVELSKMGIGACPSI
jgi:xylulose-5-phosphate/fructose-6-phosphate phosphoketolase